MIIDFLDENGKWQCISCGACCKMVKVVLPKLAKKDGSCIHLEDNKCKIYETRPEICRQKREDGDDGDLAKACNKIRNAIRRNQW